MLQATRNDGLLKELGVTPSGGLVFDNSDFVETVSSDDSPLGAMMSSLHPSALTVSVMKTPKAWRSWSEEVDESEVSSMLNRLPAEIESGLRMIIPRKELSVRSVDILKNADVSVSTRGIQDGGVPESASRALAGLVYQAYYLIERNTTASLKSDKARLSAIRRDKFAAVVDILDNKRDILGVTLLSTYTEPSLTMVKRFYCLATILGVQETHRMLNTLYEEHCGDQRDSVLTIADSVI